MSFSFHQAKLSTKIISTFLIGSVFLFPLILFTTFSIIRDQTYTSQQEKATILLEMVEPSISLALYLGVGDLGTKLSSLTRLEEVVGIVIKDHKGHTLLHYTQKNMTASDATIKVTQELFEPSSLKPIGEITLDYSGKEFVETMNHFYFFFFTLFIVILFLSFLMMLWINHLLSPIKLIAAKVHNFRPGEKIIFDIPYQQQEFKFIVEAFKSMQERVWEYANKLQTINKNLEKKVIEQTKEALHHLYYDNLTKLPNRLKLQEELSHFETNTIAILNINSFKEINDFFGIDAGDSLLYQIAFWFQEIGYHPYRIGGDVFAFRMTTSNYEAFQHSMRTLLVRFGEKSFIIRDELIYLHATLGIALNTNKALIHADIALNQARSSKIALAIYNRDEKIEQQLQRNIEISTQIRHALSEHRIVCQYQPIVSSKSGLITKYEALVRLQDENGILIGPNEFLPIAKKTKLYHQITHEVIHQACHQFADRSEEFSVNLSNTDILDEPTVKLIERIILKTNTANRIIFEILESEGIENFDEIAQFTNHMKSLGAKIAIDDFGTGYSNYENILKLNVDILKIDGSLIKSINTNPRHKLVVEGIVDFAKRMHISTVAEFVATEDILTTIQEIGINNAQGFYIGKPQFLHSSSASIED
jgi:diguanylate cyclase (GGDEF)-like protein